MKKIKLIGIQGDQNYESWLSNLKQVLEDLKFQDMLEEVNKIDAILNFDISTTPALIINDTILLEQNSHIPDSHEMKASILNYLNQRNINLDEFPYDIP